MGRRPPATGAICMSASCASNCRASKSAAAARSHMCVHRHASGKMPMGCTAATGPWVSWPAVGQRSLTSACSYRDMLHRHELTLRLAAGRRRGGISTAEVYQRWYHSACRMIFVSNLVVLWHLEACICSCKSADRVSGVTGAPGGDFAAAQFIRTRCHCC